MNLLTKINQKDLPHSIISGPFSGYDRPKIIEALFDRRQHIKNPCVFPWSVHGYVECLFSGGIGTRGTGTLIGRSAFVTAAHCLYHRDRDGHLHLPTDVIFYADLGDKKVAIKAISNAIYTHPSYLENDSNFDFALVALKEDVGSYTGWASLRVLDDKILDQKRVNVSGYPAQKTVFDVLLGRHTEFMYTMEGPIVVTEKHKIFYNIDTSGGQSGSGVWYLDEENLVSCIGIHVMGRSKVMGNSGIRINQENFNLILNWLKISIENNQI